MTMIYQDLKNNFRLQFKKKQKGMKTFLLEQTKNLKLITYKRNLSNYKMKEK